MFVAIQIGVWGYFQISETTTLRYLLVIVASSEKLPRRSEGHGVQIAWFLVIKYLSTSPGKFKMLDFLPEMIKIASASPSKFNNFSYHIRS